MAALRPHLALTVSDVERSIPFYAALFGVLPEKAKPGYAKFSIAEPALNLTLNQGQRSDALGAFNHAGIQVASTADVLAARDRLVTAGLAAFDEMDTTCCYARQDKIWVHDPDGTPWEIFATHEDAEVAGDGGPRAAGASDGPVGNGGPAPAGASDGPVAPAAAAATGAAGRGHGCGCTATATDAPATPCCSDVTACCAQSGP